MGYEKLIVKKEGPVVTIAMNYAKNLNAMDRTMVNELITAFNDCGADDSVRVVVFTSAIRAFCGGGDIKYFYDLLKGGGSVDTSDFGLATELSKAMKKCPKPIIGAVNGAAAGAGFILALNCDYVIATEDTKFIAAFVNLGLIPDTGGIYMMSKAMGTSKALEIAMTGRPVSAAEAKEIGFVAQVVSADDFEAAVAKAAKRFAGGPSLAYAKMKELIWTAEYSNYDEYAKQEGESNAACALTEDFKQRVFAFIEKK